MAITITKQPVNATAPIGTKVSFKVEAEGEGLTYQWKLQQPDGTTWSDSGAASATTNELTFAAQSHHDGFKYRCEITDSTGNVATTDVATLTIYKPLTITKQPTSKVGFVGDTVTFTVEAMGSGLTYQWEKRNTANSTWENSYADSATMATITFTVEAHQNGYGYRCKITDALGIVVYTIAVTLTALDVTSANGLVSSETLTAIADAIREKTETTDKILPANMAGLIATIETGGVFEVMTGSATPSANTETLNLGATLPESDNYLFICIAEIFGANSSLSISTNLYTHYIRRAVVINKDGTKRGETSRTLYQGSGITEYSSSTDTNFGILSGDSVSVANKDNYTYRFRQSVVYRWWYAYV